ncbi:MAG TPA: RodZ domain-containing protein [Aestuariivirgaceae bacterium]
MNETHQAAFPHARPAFRQKPDGSIDPAGEAGWFLQRERERRGLELNVIAQLLGIHESHLGGIESGDLTRLPSRSEALAMVGAYAKYLGFDPQPLVQHFVSFLPLPIAPRKRSGSPKPLSSAKIIPFASALKLAMSTRGLKVVSSIAGVLLLTSAALAVLNPAREEPILAGIDSFSTASIETEADDGSRVRISQTPLEEDYLPPPPAASLPAKPEAEALGDLGSFITQQIEQLPETNHVPATAKSNDRKETVPRLQEHAAAGNSRVLLKAAGTIWIRVEDTRGNVIVSQTMRKGESYAVPARDDLTITTKDGSMIGYQVDGVDKGVLGTPGEIVLGRSLSPAKLSGGRG